MASASAATSGTDDIDPTEWGSRLREFRKFRDLTQQELALRLSDRLARTIGQDAISEWESGRRRPTDVQRIALARCLGVPAPSLFPYPPDVR